MTEKELTAYKERLRARWGGRDLAGPKYPGFGEEHNGAEWARRLNIPRNSLWRYLTHGLTIEEVAEIRGITYPAD